MKYCSACGHEVEYEDDFCASCGRDLNGSATEKIESTAGANNEAQSTQATSINLGSRDRHYNVESVAYVTNSSISLTLTGWFLVSVPSLLSVLVLWGWAEISNIELNILFTGLVSSAVLYYLIIRGGGFKIGTLTGEDTYKGDSDELVQTISHHVESPIVITNEIENRYRKMGYNYYLFPNNIVKISRQVTNNLAQILLFVLVIFFIDIILVVIERPYVALLVTLLSVILAYYIYHTEVYIKIQLQSGETKKFVMSESDAEMVIQTFTSG